MLEFFKLGKDNHVIFTFECTWKVPLTLVNEPKSTTFSRELLFINAIVMVFRDGADRRVIEAEDAALIPWARETRRGNDNSGIFPFALKNSLVALVNWGAYNCSSAGLLFTVTPSGIPTNVGLPETLTSAGNLRLTRAGLESTMTSPAEVSART